MSFVRKVLFFKKLTIKKIVNYFKLAISYGISYILKKPICWGMPIRISIEPTNICNLFCKECPTGMQILKREKGNIDIEIYKKIIDEIYSYLTSITLYFQGEPYLNKSLFKMISYANEKNIYTTTSTNAHFLDNENIKKTFKSDLDEIIISIDGTNQEIYEYYRKGGNFNTVLQATKNIINEKKTINIKKPTVIIQFLVFKTNEHQIADIKQLAESIGVDKLELKSAQIYNFENNNNLIPTINKYSRYKKNKSNVYTIKSKLKNRCWRMWTNPVITISGDVIPCCFDKDAKYIMGNVYNNTFKEIWQSKKYQNFRKKILKSRKNIEMCRNCTEGLNL